MRHQWVNNNGAYYCSECFLPMLDVKKPSEECPGIQDEQQE